MAKKPDEESDLALVKELVFGASDLQLERYGHAETVAGRTPDYRVLRAGKLAAFSEVKSPRDDWLDELLAAAPAGQIVGGARRDPTFNRLARHVEKAASQFEAVNPNRALPNILVLVNHANAVHFGDLLETVSGHFYATTGGRYPTMVRISGRIREAVAKVDLFVWMNSKTSKAQYLFNDPGSQQGRAVCDLLGIDPTKIKMI